MSTDDIDDEDDQVAEDQDEDELDESCQTCGGSGGGEGYWRCGDCSGTGMDAGIRARRLEDRRAEEADRLYDQWKDERAERERNQR